MTPTVSIDPDSPIPPFEQLRIQLDRQIRGGVLIAGRQLPTVRQLATDLGLAKNTVVRAYRALERDGLIVGDRRRGTVVLERHTTASERDQVIAAAARRFADDLAGVDATLHEAITALRQALRNETGDADTNVPAPR
jgi:DNA-binding transcriptional regulator YhcF (GntR family)